MTDRPSGGFGQQTIAVIADEVRRQMAAQHGAAIPAHRVDTQSEQTAMGLAVFGVGVLCFLLGAGVLAAAIFSPKVSEVGWPILVGAVVFVAVGLYCVIFGAVAKATGEATKAAKAAGGALGAVAAAAHAVQRVFGKNAAAGNDGGGA